MWQLPFSSWTLHPHTDTPAFCPHRASVRGSAPPATREPTHEAGNTLLLLLQLLCKLWSLENHDHHVCVAPAHLWQVGIPPTSYSWPSQHYVKAGMEKGHVSAPTIPNTICTKHVTLNAVFSPKASQENSGPSCPAASHVPLLFASHICFFPLQARFFSVVLMSWKKEIRREK